MPWRCRPAVNALLAWPHRGKLRPLRKHVAGALDMADAGGRPARRAPCGLASAVAAPLALRPGGPIARSGLQELYLRL